MEIMEAPDPKWINLRRTNAEIAKELGMSVSDFSKCLNGKLENKRSKTPKRFTEEQKVRLEAIRLSEIQMLELNNDVAFL
jgi:hypothetical protein